MTSRPVSLSAIVLAGVLALSGCIGSDAVDPETTLMPAPVPTVTPSDPAELIDFVSGYDVTVAVYPLDAYASTGDSGYALPGQDVDLFPAGTRVVALRFVVTGYVPFGEADISGFTFDQSAFEGRPELAILDSKDGPQFVRDAGLTWLTEELPVAGLENNRSYSFAAAWYVPPGATTLSVRFGRDGLSSGPLPLRIPLTTAE